MEKSKSIFKNFDYKLFICIILISIYGLVVLSSAVKSLPNGNAILKTQIFATILGFVGMLFFSAIDYRNWKYLYKLIYILCVFLLIVTLIFGKGPKGVRSWLYIKSFGFQPSEFVKVGLIISFAAYLEEVGDTLNHPRVLLKVLIFALIPIILIQRQPDTGTAIVYLFFIMLMLFSAGISWKYIGAFVLIAVGLAPLIWFSLENYQKNRFYIFFNPSADTQGTGWQYTQGKIAIGSGQLFGKGLYKGTQTQFNFISEKQNDFIFPVLVEELGFFGGILLFVLYAYILFRLYKIARESADSFGSYMVIGFAAMLIFHIWENIGMTLGLMPITGIPLPFFSSGGTFQMVNLMIIGFCLSVSSHKNIKYF